MSVEDERKLFVAGLPETATEDGLRELFEATGGSVAEVTVPRDRATGKVRGFAFLTMGSASEAAVARRQLDGSLQDGRSISVRAFRGDRSAPGAPAPRPSQPPQESEDSTLYVGNLPFDTQITDLEALFGEAGFAEVRRVHLPTDQDGRARGFGFVTLASADDARRAVDELGGVALRGRQLSISVARARGNKPSPGSPRPSRPPMSQAPPRAAATPRTGRPPGAGFGDGDVPFLAPPPEFGASGAAAADPRKAMRWEKKKDKKRKNRLGGPEKSSSKRRRGGDFHSTRPDDYVNDWDDD